MHASKVERRNVLSVGHKVLKFEPYGNHNGISIPESERRPAVANTDYLARLEIARAGRRITRMRTAVLFYRDFNSGFDRGSMFVISALRRHNLSGFIDNINGGNARDIIELGCDVLPRLLGSVY